jgi:predicted ribonuclease YlaK
MTRRDFWIRSPDITRYAPVIGAAQYIVLLVPGVLAEIDAHKVNHRVPAVRENARKVSDRIKGWRNQGSLAVGVRVQSDVWVSVEGRDFTKTLSWLNADNNDDRIIGSIPFISTERKSHVGGLMDTVHAQLGVTGCAAS